jgi:hypothetical protein
MITSLSSLNDLIVGEEFYCSSIAIFSPDLVVREKWPVPDWTTFAKEKAIAA